MTSKPLSVVLPALATVASTSLNYASEDKKLTLIIFGDAQNLFCTHFFRFWLWKSLNEGKLTAVHNEQQWPHGIALLSRRKKFANGKMSAQWKFFFRCKSQRICFGLSRRLNTSV